MRRARWYDGPVPQPNQWTPHQGRRGRGATLVTLRVSREEHEAIVAAARAAGRSISDHLRALLGLTGALHPPVKRPARKPRNKHVGSTFDSFLEEMGDTKIVGEMADKEIAAATPKRRRVLSRKPRKR